MIDEIECMNVAEIVDIFRESCNEFDPSKVVVMKTEGDDGVDGFELSPVRKETPDEYYRRLERVKFSSLRRQEQMKAKEESDKKNDDALDLIRQRSIRNQLEELGVDPDKLEN